MCVFFERECVQERERERVCVQEREREKEHEWVMERTFLLLEGKDEIVTSGQLVIRMS